MIGWMQPFAFRFSALMLNGEKRIELGIRVVEPFTLVRQSQVHSGRSSSAILGGYVITILGGTLITLTTTNQYKPPFCKNGKTNQLDISLTITLKLIVLTSQQLNNCRQQSVCSPLALRTISCVELLALVSNLSSSLGVHVVCSKGYQLARLL